MMGIREDLLDCSLYIYDSEVSAMAGERVGGCGFFIGVPLPNDCPLIQLYAVTNKHVINGDCTTLRVNTNSGGFDVVGTRREDWVEHPSGDDVVACPIDLSQAHKLNFIPIQEVLAKEDLVKMRIGLGETTILIGRFVNHEGRQQNRPTVRFGSISSMPNEPLDLGNGRFQESYLVEVRSIGGYSGSPVFVAHPLMTFPAIAGQLMASFSLLGIDCGHLEDCSYVEELVHGTWAPRDTLRSVGNTGMAYVLPSWRIREVLDSPLLAAMREKDADNYFRDNRSG